jgi:hypothetical protein
LNPSPQIAQKARPKKAGLFNVVNTESGEILERRRPEIMRLSSARFCNKESGQPVSLGNWSRVQFQGDGSIIFTLESERPELSEEIKDKRLQNLEKVGQYNGFLSRNTKSRVKKMLSNWMQAIKSNHQNQNTTIPGLKKVEPTFLTLTLSDDQRHDDNHIKRRYLGRFIQELKRKHGLKNYFWRAESQNINATNNGRIHFHLILDIYIEKEIVRSLWNEIQRDYVLSYLERTKNTRPPASTYIEQPKNFEGIVDYCLKYILKSSPEIDEKGNKTDQSDTFKQKYRKIEGRIWGASDELKALDKGFTIDQTEKTKFKTIIKELYNIDKDDVFAVHGPKFMYIKLSANSINKLPILQNCIYLKGLQHFKQLYNKEYAEKFKQIQQKNIDLDTQKRQELREQLLEIEKKRRFRNKKIRFSTVENLQNAPPNREIQKFSANAASNTTASENFKALLHANDESGRNWAKFQPGTPF